MLRQHRGFTLIELMVVVAIVGLLAAMSVAAYGAIGSRSAPQNASHDFYSTLTRAKARAQESSSDVWVIIYPTLDKAGGTSGHGAWFVYEDPDGNFTTGGTLTWASFAPPTNITPGESDRLVESTYLDDYQGKNVRFGPVSGVALTGPFTVTSVPASGCSFCGTDTRAAIVFTPSGAARFVNTGGAVTANRVGALGLVGTDNTSAGYEFGIARATGFVTSFR